MAVDVAQNLELQLSAYSAELHAFLDGLPGRLKSGPVAPLGREVAALLERAPAVPGERWPRLRHALAELRSGLEGGAARAYLLARYEEAARAYEHWLASRRAQGRRAAGADSLKPLRGARTWFHIAMGLLATTLYQLVLTRAEAVGVLVTLLSIFAALEVLRRLSGRFNHLLVTNVFKLIVRPREYYEINSATWYLLALCLLTPVFSRPAVLTGILVLAFGDPAAAWIGKRFGKLKLHGKKSLLGSLAFLGAGAAVSLAFLLAFYPGLPLWKRLCAAGLASLTGAVAELFSERLDDNLTVPIAAVLAAALLV